MLTSLRILCFCLCSCAALLSISVYASAPQINQQNSLAEHPTWLKLLHFDRHGLFRQPRSAVTDNGFFFAEDGAYSPNSELQATIHAMQLPPEPGVSHASCLFPARTQWLSEQGAVQLSAGIHCPEWDEWRQTHGEGRIGVTFASGYLGNPASFFGHLLLHIETDPEQFESVNAATYLLDSSLNFGADVPDHEGMFTYMIKGLFGGYPARYSEAPFYRNTTLYNENQMRDSWYYALDLSPEKNTFLLAHLYEVLGQNFDYLFLSQNCASRIARTLELVIDDDLAKGYAPWVSPEQVMRLIRPYSEELIYFPSRRRITENKFHTLESNEQAALREAWPSLENFSLQRPLYQVLNPSSQAAVLDALLSHALYIKQSGHEKISQEVQQSLLLATLNLPVQQVSSKPSPVPTPPHINTPSASARLGAVYTDGLGEGLQLSYRPLHYDLIESNDARMPYAALELMRIELDVYQSQARFAEVVLFNITNLNALQTGLPEQSSLAWQAKAEVTRSNLACRECLNAGFHLSAGKSWQYRNLTLYTMFGGAARTTGYQQGAIAFDMQAGGIYDWSTQQRTLLKANYEDAAKGTLSRSWYASLTHRVQLSPRNDIRAEFKKDRTSYQLHLNWGIYW